MIGDCFKTKDLTEILKQINKDLKDPKAKFLPSRSLIFSLL